VTSPQYKYPYLDSSVFIGWIKGENIDGVDRKDIAKHILKLAENGEFKICSSALTLAEVHKKRGSKQLSDAEDESILEFFEHEFIDVVDIDRTIGEHANRLCRQYPLRPNDAIHLASALKAKCDVLLTWDGPLASIQHPDIIIENPRKIGQLSLPKAQTEET
jgi:predicted nucleic acid-binding protein